MAAGIQLEEPEMAVVEAVVVEDMSHQLLEVVKARMASQMVLVERRAVAQRHLIQEVAVAVALIFTREEVAVRAL